MIIIRRALHLFAHETIRPYRVSLPLYLSTIHQKPIFLTHPFIRLYTGPRRFRWYTGDWICPVCEFHNYHRNADCGECGEPAYPHRYVRPGDWVCGCGQYNYEGRLSCVKCEILREDLRKALIKEDDDIEREKTEE